MRYAIDHPEAVALLVLVNPLSPYGFGGTKDTDGTPCFDDYAGSGGGIGNDAFVAGLENRDRSEEGDRPLHERCCEPTTSTRPTSSTASARNRI